MLSVPPLGVERLFLVTAPPSVAYVEIHLKLDSGPVGNG
jgi:hypothetical protein